MKTRRHADNMTGLSPEQKRDTQKQRAGSRAGYRFSAEEESKATEIATALVSGEMSVEEIPSTLARNVWSALQTEGHYDLARSVRDAFFPSPVTEGLRELVREMIEQ
jgi:hypothetical protein